MRNDLKAILLRNYNVEEQIEMIEELYADKSEVEKIKHWRDRYYSIKRAKDNLELKHSKILDKMIKIHEILKEK